MKVVTWRSPNGETADICPDCEARLTAAGQWPRDYAGAELCQVERGLHSGGCEAHPKPARQRATAKE